MDQTHPSPSQPRNWVLQRLLSSDSHIIEPPDLWVTRVPARWRDQVPRVQRIDGTDWWIYDGRRIGSVSGRKRRSGATRAGESVDSRGRVLTHSIFENVTPAAYTPDLYLQTNLDDGVVGMVIRPTQGITNYCIADPQVFGPICRAYNDWISEFCSVSPQNLKCVAMLNNYDAEDAVRELERCKALGFVGGIISVYPGREHHYGQPEYERLWAAASSQDFPLSLHVLTNHNGPYGVPFDQVDYSLRANADYWVRMSLADMIFNGVFDRHPDLRIESGEHEAAWLPNFRWQLNWIYDNRIRKRRQRAILERRPGDYLAENLFLSIIYDDLAIAQCEHIGVDRLMWGSDFPHEQSTHPHSLEFANTLLGGLAQGQAETIAVVTTARLYGFDLDHPRLRARHSGSGSKAAGIGSSIQGQGDEVRC